MATRIYQGKIVKAEYERAEEVRGNMSPLDALVNTFSLLQDATNYHLVALAGMAENSGSAIGVRFKERVRSIWEECPKGVVGAKTLQQSVVETLHLNKNASFDEAVSAIYEGCEMPEALPYVQQIILELTGQGEGVIQQEGRSLLPKLCDASFGGNYPYSAKEKKAKKGKQRLIDELNRDGITQQDLEQLAAEMDLSWAGVKTQPTDDHSSSLVYTQTETIEQVKVAMEEMCEVIRKGSDKAWVKYAKEKNIDLYTEVTQTIIKRAVIDSSHLLAKNNKAAKELKQAAIFFMYYPCALSAGMLRTKLGKNKEEKTQGREYDCFALANDPMILARGERGYIYKGYTALPDWKQSGSAMYSSEWDILAFKEALKIMHAYELKTKERKAIVDSLQSELDYRLYGKGKVSLANPESEEVAAVLGGDPRYELLKELVREISPDIETDYTISRRSLNAYDEVREKWLMLEKVSEPTEQELVEVVRSVQGGGGRFGSGVLFEALCREKYRPIWHDHVDSGKKTLPRSGNIIKDFCLVQELESEIEQYSRPVRITAAEAQCSPRQLLYSDLGSFGKKCKGHEFIKQQDGKVRLRVAVRNEQGHLEGATIVASYSAPRFERDELGTDAACWLGTEARVSWLQPMMKALDIEPGLVRMKKEPAVALQVKRIFNSKAGDEEHVCFLNFPVSLELDALHKQIGKADVWSNSMFVGKDEKLHLHWPDTYDGNSAPWWLNQSVIQNGYDVLGVDLGVRYAAAWALNHIQTEPTMLTQGGTLLTGRYVGQAAERKWYGFARKQGLIRIEGEGSQRKHKESRSSADKAQLPDGITGATKEDYELAKKVLNRVGAPCPEQSAYNVLVLCNAALRVFKRLISRARVYQSLLVKLKDSEKQARALQEAKKYFDHNEATRLFIPGILERIEQGATADVVDMLLSALLVLRNDLPQVATDVTNLILPRKHGHWQWVEMSKPGYICSGRIELLDGGNSRRCIYHRGGLSISRLTQLEALRQTLQSLNRVLWMEPGVLSPFGREMRNLPVVDPCPDLLRKIEKVREQRVNKIAHDIVAQALGVRLKKSRPNKNIHGKDIVHGEYEKIPGRKPVDFVVLENLSRYLTSVDRTSEENSTLMRWAHRQILAKVKQLLEEVFGIPVVCAHAAYTSKFDSLTSSPGFRVKALDKKYLSSMMSKGNGNPKLMEIYGRILEEVPFEELPTGLKLIVPHERNGGEFFVSCSCGNVRVLNADINAAINIAWRGIAAPDALELLHRVRLEKKKGEWAPRATNKREKALKGVITASASYSSDATKQLASTFWVNSSSSSAPGDATFTLANGVQHSLLSARALWDAVKEHSMDMCALFNWRILQNHTSYAELLRSYLIERGILKDDDDIPL